MKATTLPMKSSFLTILMFLPLLLFSGCQETGEPQAHEQQPEPAAVTPEYFLLRPEVEKAYGYSHAVKTGNQISISGAVSMDDQGNPTAVGDMAQQIKNCYADIEKILKHYGCTFDDVVVENIFTTNMSLFLEHAAYRNSIYKNHFPAGSWLGVTELAVPEFMVEIELEVHKTDDAR